MKVDRRGKKKHRKEESVEGWNGNRDSFEFTKIKSVPPKIPHPKNYVSIMLRKWFPFNEPRKDITRVH